MTEYLLAFYREFVILEKLKKSVRMRKGRGEERRMEEEKKGGMEEKKIGKGEERE